LIDCIVSDRMTMGLQRNTIKKLLRKDFPEAKPLVVDPAEWEKLGIQVNAPARVLRWHGHGGLRL